MKISMKFQMTLFKEFIFSILWDDREKGYLDKSYRRKIDWKICKNTAVFNFINHLLSKLSNILVIVTFKCCGYSKMSIFTFFDNLSFKINHVNTFNIVFLQSIYIMYNKLLKKLTTLKIKLFGDFIHHWNKKRLNTIF